ncbi:putative reverse transcriptase domain-containing protein [Tanacetum coccineum]
MVNVIPPDHVDDVPVVEPNQHDDVPVIPKPVLVDEDEDPEEDEFEEEEDPQEEEDDMEVDVKEDENEPELTYTYKEVDPLNPQPPASESEPDDEIEVKNPIEHEDETVPVSVYKVGESSTAAIPLKDGDSLLPGFMRRDIDSLFGNEVRSSVEQGMAAIEKLVEKLGNTEDRVECKKLKKELEEASVNAAIAAERTRQANARNDASGFRPVRGRDTALAIRECTFAGFMKCNPTVFCEVEGVVELRRCFEKTESVSKISECAEGKKVKFASTTLEGPTLTWWKTKVVTMGLEIVNQMPWTELKQLMTAEFCPLEEVQRMEHELWNLKSSQRQGNARAIVTDPTDGKLPLCEHFFTRHAGQCTVKCHKYGKVGHKVRYCKEKSVATGANAQPIWTCYDCGEQGPNVVTGTFLLNNQYASVLFDLGFDRSFVNTRFSSLLDIKPIKIEDSYEVELADERIVSTNTVLKGCTLSLVNHVFEIDIMPIELGTFDVIIGAD